MIDVILVSDHFNPGGVPPYVKQADLNKDGVVDLPNEILPVINELGTVAVCQFNTPLPVTSTAGGALAVDADGGSTDLSDTVETKRSVLVDVPFLVSVHVATNPGTVHGYNLRLHWDEALLDFTQRDAGQNDRWEEIVSDPSFPIQFLGPGDDGAGNEAYIELGATSVTPAFFAPLFTGWSGTGPIAQFEFTCQAPGTASITLMGAGEPTLLFGRPATEYTPTLANAQINCLVEETPVGTDIEVVPGAGITVTFGDVTTSGSTTVTTSTLGAPPPSGLTIVGIAGEPVYYDINTSAGFTGTATICIEYDETQVFGDEANLTLRKLDPSLDITQSVDTVNNIICGKTTSFSIFTIMEPLSPVGGIALDADAGLRPLDSPESSSGFGLLAWAIAAVAGAVALGGAALYTRKRLTG